MSRAPIGVFDSGVGGLSVLREIRRALPHEDLRYVADSGYAPYGDQPDAVIRERAIAIAGFLTSQSAKAIVVACNTATSVAVDALRSALSMPIVAIEPALKPAAVSTKSSVVGILATAPTLSSERFGRLLQAHGASVRVLLQPCPGLAERVESGQLDGPETRSLVAQFVSPLIAQGADTLVLGCTHYPFLLPVIESVAGPGVTIIDPAAAVARELRRRLETGGLAADGAEGPGDERFWTTGAVSQTRTMIEQLWGRNPDVRHLA